MGREHNPYRNPMAEHLRGEALFGGGGPHPRTHDSDSGPGLLASDIDRMVRQHYLDGFEAGRRRAAEALPTHATAWDEGYTEGVKERRGGLAQDFYARLMAVRLAIVEAQGLPKSRAHAQLDVIAEELEPVREFALALMGREAKPLDEAVDPT